MKRDFEGCQKEFYSNPRITYKQYFYNGKLYYLNWSGICRSNEDGTEIELVVEMNEHHSSDLTVYSLPEITVNSTGIYFFGESYVDGTLSYKTSRYSFDGNLINEITLANSDDTAIECVYIYKTKIFYILLRDDEDERSSSGFYIDIETGEKRQFCKQAKDIDHLYGTDKYAVIYAQYESAYAEDGGWYLFDFESEKYICLSSKKYPPHLVLKHPEYFDEDNGRLTYDIFRFDLTRNIMWVKEDGKLKPKSFLNGIKDIAKMPEWDISRCLSLGNAFFNGEILFNANSYKEYSAYDREGYCCTYPSYNDHGYFDCFAIHNNLLYMQTEMKYPEQYEIENSVVTKLRNCWFNEEPRETVGGLSAWDDSDL